MQWHVSPDKAAVVTRIKAERAIAVIRTDSIDSALRAAEAAVSGGFRAIEITFSFPKASDAIAKLTESKDVDQSKIDQLRTLLASGKKVKADDLVKVFSLPVGGDLK